MCSKNIQRNGALEIGFSTMNVFLLAAFSVQEFLARKCITVVPLPHVTFLIYRKERGRDFMMTSEKNCGFIYRV
jgi:hypothetical protein